MRTRAAGSVELYFDLALQKGDTATARRVWRNLGGREFGQKQRYSAVWQCLVATFLDLLHASFVVEAWT